MKTLGENILPYFDMGRGAYSEIRFYYLKDKLALNNLDVHSDIFISISYHLFIYYIDIIYRLFF